MNTLNEVKPFPKIIGFAGPATAGKTSAALIVARTYPDFTRVSFADPIRAMLKALDLTDREMSEGKNIPNAKLCMRTPREAMQTLGTEWGRDRVGQSIWLDAAMRRVAECEEIGFRVAFDDVRFDNEADLIRQAGGLIIHVDRPGLPPRMPHASEAGVTFLLGDLRVYAEDLLGLKAQLITLLNGYAAY